MTPLINRNLKTIPRFKNVYIKIPMLFTEMDSLVRPMFAFGSNNELYSKEN